MNYSIFRKPSRYIGNEINSIQKEGDIKVALCFPDTYEIGMSHLGLKILYSIINSIEYASAERVYAPWVDYDAYLRHNNIPLTSMEFRRPLKDFEIVGFTLQYELSYTNILQMLDLGGIPIRSKMRGDDHPLIIAGGPCAVNPLPLIPFIDAFVIGDGEEVIEEILNAYSQVKGRAVGRNRLVSRTRDRHKILDALAKIEGVYVPNIHDIKKKPIKKRIVEDLDQVAFPESPIVPYNQIIHDRVTIEIARGCSRGCRFCQAGMIYRPVRERSPEKVLSLAQISVDNTGYEEISFSSLSSGDYSNLSSLLKQFNNLCRGSRTAISLPSLRVGSISRTMLKEIKSVRKTGFTIAPEAGTERLRSVINKDFTNEEYEITLSTIFSEGWKHVKLYFMIGLPSEDQKDIDGLIDMAVHALETGKKISGRRININVGISAFVPKPHTPFQWTGQQNASVLREKQDYIKKAFKKRGINYKGQHIEHSLLEAVFSRADEKGAELLEAAWHMGCRFDGWAEHFDFSKWLKAADKLGMDLHEYATRNYNINDNLPWDFVDIGIDKEFLKSEYQAALRGQFSEDCRKVCHSCGLECGKREQEAGASGQGPGSRRKGSKIRDQRDEINKFPAKLRVIFSKTGQMRYLSHHELITTLIRAFNRAAIPLAYSTGFHPHPKISFGPALPVGIEGLNEYLDIELDGAMDPESFSLKVNDQLPDGLEVRETHVVPVGGKSLNALFSQYEYEIRINSANDPDIETFMNSDKCIIVRKEKSIDVRRMVQNAQIKKSSLHLTLIDSEHTKARLYDVLEGLFQKPTNELQSLLMRRTSLNSYNNIDKQELIQSR